MSMKDKPTIKEVKEDMAKFCDKINYMMLETGEGKAPPIFKVILLKRVVDAHFEVYKNRMDTEGFELANKIIDEFMKVLDAKLIEDRDGITKYKKEHGY